MLPPLSGEQIKAGGGAFSADSIMCAMIRPFDVEKWHES